MISITASAQQQAGPSSPHRPGQAVSEAPASRIVPKPVPASQERDARGYQLGQMRRRFSPRETTLRDGSTVLTFGLAPSDPDFPFELERLECELRVPAGYPPDGKDGDEHEVDGTLPTLAVRNKDMPRGFAINIERGWDRLVRERRGKGATLLALVNALDKSLEALLSEQKAETVKVTIFKDTRHLTPGADADLNAGKGGNSSRSATPEPTSQAQTKPPLEPAAAKRPAYVPEPSFTRDEIAQAKARRAQETRQLEARMGRDPAFRRSPDGVVYTLPLVPPQRPRRAGVNTEPLPPGLRAVRSCQLVVPLLYPLQELRVLLSDADPADAEPVEELFARGAASAERRPMTLVAHVNFLAQNLHVLARQAKAIAEKRRKEEEDEREREKEKEEQAEGQGEKDEGTKLLGREDKSHIQVIPRPPEWTLADDDESSDYDSDDSDEEEGGGGAALSQPEDQPAATTAATTAPVTSSSSPAKPPARGTAMSFPSVELHGAELLQVAVLNLSVRCARCKTLNDATGLRDGAESKMSSCRKCAAPFAVRFRQELVHQGSARAGFVDASGCTVADMLPSTFVATCAGCSTPAPGIVSVRGETTTNVCRECHGRFTFKIPEVKFLAVGPSGLPALPAAGPRQKKDEKLGLRAGEPLPDRGACAHYRRSYRWFRFGGCCGRVYACDVCHDEAEDHPHEWANRMICGWCSREQNYSPESCAFCGRSVIGRRGKGYWEGGKGTRDRVLMRRGDKRKYRRVGGGGEAAAKKQE